MDRFGCIQRKNKSLQWRLVTEEQRVPMKQSTISPNNYSLGVTVIKLIYYFKFLFPL